MEQTLTRHPPREQQTQQCQEEVVKVAIHCGIQIAAAEAVVKRWARITFVVSGDM
jgi:hypothetical protein